MIFCPHQLTNTHSTAPFQVRSASVRVGLTKRRKSERRVTLMVVTIVLVFILCWLPFFTTNIVNLIHIIPETNTTLYFFLVILTYVNSCANPFLYGFLSNFRQSFEKVLCFHKSNSGRKNNDNNNAPSRGQRAGGQSPPVDAKSPIMMAQCGEQQNGQAQNREVRLLKLAQWEETNPDLGWTQMVSSADRIFSHSKHTCALFCRSSCWRWS